MTAAQRLPSSRLTEATAAMQGVYSKQNTSRGAAAAGESAAPSAAASVFAGDDDSDDDSITADTADTTAQGNAILQQILASDLIPDYDQPGYYRSVAISFCCTGEDSDFLSMLDDMAANYPSVQLVSFSIDTRSFADTDGSAVTATAFNVSLNVILCDKGGVQP